MWAIWLDLQKQRGRPRWSLVVPTPPVLSAPRARPDALSLRVRHPGEGAGTSPVSSPQGGGAPAAPRRCSHSPWVRPLSITWRVLSPPLLPSLWWCSQAPPVSDIPSPSPEGSCLPPLPSRLSLHRPLHKGVNVAVTSPSGHLGLREFFNYRTWLLSHKTTCKSYWERLLPYFCGRISSIWQKGVTK